MPSLYPRGRRIWARLKHVRKPGKWGAIPTPFLVGQEDDAKRWAAESQRLLDKKHKGVASGIVTVRDYAKKWLAERLARKLASYRDDAGRINNHALPIIGDIPLADLELIHIRDMVRKLEQTEMAPRTILHVLSIVKTMLKDARRDKLLVGEPWDLPRHEVPQKSDKDPEWRELATFAGWEVYMLCTDERIPIVRRVQYALKALAGLRHGEVSGLRWRNWVDDQPLSALSVARSYQNRRTKTEVTRRVPVVPKLKMVLDAWTIMCDENRTRGRDHLVVSTRAGGLVSAHYAHECFLDDLKTLGLRVEAGEHRQRGGHDLRAWFITTCKENGANPEDVHRITHTKRTDVTTGYTRTNWTKICEAAAKVELSYTPRTLPNPGTNIDDCERPQRDSKPFPSPRAAAVVRSSTRNSQRLLTDHDRSLAALSEAVVQRPVGPKRA